MDWLKNEVSNLLPGDKAKVVNIHGFDISVEVGESFYGLSKVDYSSRSQTETYKVRASNQLEIPVEIEGIPDKQHRHVIKSAVEKSESREIS